jgi:hypothetical protein
VCGPKDLLSKEEALSHMHVLAFGYDANVINASLNKPHRSPSEDSGILGRPLQ